MSDSQSQTERRVLAAAVPAGMVAELERLLPQLSFVRVGTALEGIAEFGRQRPAALLIHADGPTALADGFERLMARAEGAGIPVVYAMQAADAAGALAACLGLTPESLPIGERLPRTEEEDDLWTRFRPTILARVHNIENAVVALLAGGLDAPARMEAARDAHRLAGSLGSLGFPRGSEIAREIESRLAAGSDADPFLLSELTLTLAQELDDAPSAGLPVARRMTGARGIAILEPDGAAAERLLVEAETRGMRAHRAESIAEVGRLLQQHTAQVVVAGITAENHAAVLTALATWRESHPDLPVIVSSDTDTFEHRLEIARMGACGFVSRPAPPALIMDLMAAALADFGAGRTILAVDDDPVILAQLRALVAPSGLRLIGLATVETFWDTLAESDPDLLLLDVDMPGSTGIDLCRVVRNEPRWRSLPILFLTSHADPAMVQRVFAAGADDYVRKPILPAELLARIRGRLERQSHGASEAPDALTQLPKQEEGSRRLDNALARASRYDQPLALAVIDVDGLATLNASHGHIAGDGVLRRLGLLLGRRFHGDDIAMRWREDDFIVVLPGATRIQAVRRIAACMEALPQDADETIRATVSAGVAEFPLDGADASALFDAAAAALARARQVGPGTILPVAESAPPGGPDVVDVAVVEDDRVIAHLLTHALRTRGYSVRGIDDGASAMEQLASDKPTLRARLILLDISLPGADGLSVLQMLARNGVTSETAVVMLTARATESEMLQALGAGAQDYVTKPFSLPVLMQRLERILGSAHE